MVKGEELSDSGLDCGDWGLGKKEEGTLEWVAADGVPLQPSICARLIVSHACTSHF